MGTAYRLYSGKRSGSASVEVLLGALGVEHVILDATPWSEPPGPAFDELRAVNPLGQLPTLVTPGGEVLTESVAILWTLAERHPSDWLPSPGDTRRAACLRWMSFAAANVYGPVGVADYPERWTTSKSPPARGAVQRAALARMRLAWDILAAQSAGTSGFFLGDEPLICDVYLANLSRWWKMRDYLAEQHPHFAALMARVDALPAVAPIWKRNWT